MDLNNLANDLKTKINQGVSNGLNEVAQMALTDIKLHVQVRSGRLQSSWAIIQQATPNNWKIALDSPVNYRRIHYPFRIPKNVPRSRNRALIGVPLINDGDTTKFEEQAKGIIERHIEAQFPG